MMCGRQYLSSCILYLSIQQVVAAPMPSEWGALKVGGQFGNECPNISGEYQNVGEIAKNNPSHHPYDIRELDSLFPFYAKTPNHLKKFIFTQKGSQEMETIAVGEMGESIKRAYVQGVSDLEGNNNFYCEANSIVLKEQTEYSGEQGKGVTEVVTQVMLAKDGALIVHRTIHKKLTSLLIFTSSDTDEYWWRFLPVQ